MEWEPEDVENQSEEDTPREPNGKDLTQLRTILAHTKAVMQLTASAITTLLREEQRRQNQYRKGK